MLAGRSKGEAVARGPLAGVDAQIFRNDERLASGRKAWLHARRIPRALGLSRPRAV
jgi:hypothetical protein